MPKTQITAKFSNGHVDAYKGTRAVKAAWMITHRDSGRVLNSGHSLDRAKAQKTAEGNVALCVRVDHEEYPSFHLPRSFRNWHVGAMRHTAEWLRKYGLLTGDKPAKPSEVFAAAKAANDRKIAYQRSKAVIEVIDL